MKKTLIMLLAAGAMVLSAGVFAQGGGAGHGDAAAPATTPMDPSKAVDAVKDAAKDAAKAIESAAAPAPKAEEKSVTMTETKTVTETVKVEEKTEPAAAEATQTVSKGDVAFMYTATIMVILMTIPGLALFYGGLVRSKNMLSVLMQVFVIFSLISVLWVIYGYSLAFGGPGAFYGNFSKLFLSGVTGESLGATFSKGIYLPELTFIGFQGTFAAITCALIVGSYAERMKFSAVLLFTILWFTFAYLPMAHMVWYWDGPDAIKDQATLDAVTANAGWLWQKGALDFAGGTVVHINAGVAGLVAAYVLGKRIGYGKESMAPHSLTLTLVGASLLWVGWFGFNAGSNLEATGVAAFAFVNTVLATAAAVLSWMFAEWMIKGKPSLLGAASGAIAGLVAITPACGFVGIIGALVIGLVAGVACFWGVTGLKKLLNADDSGDVFGVHGVGGIVGALLTGVFASPSLGGAGVCNYITDKCGDIADFPGIGAQLWVQFQAVITAVVVSGVVAFIALYIVKMITGLRVTPEEEREGLDTTYHGESAYKY